MQKEGRELQTLTAAIIIFTKHLLNVLCPQTHLCHPTGDTHGYSAALSISLTPFQKVCIGSCKFQNVSVAGKKWEQEGGREEGSSSERTLEGGIQLPHGVMWTACVLQCLQQDDR